MNDPANECACILEGLSAVYSWPNVERAFKFIRSEHAAALLPYHDDPARQMEFYEHLPLDDQCDLEQHLHALARMCNDMLLRSISRRVAAARAKRDRLQQRKRIHHC